MKALSPAEPRFAVFDLEFKSSDGINISKLFFLTWLPETKIKFKMLYATGKEAFKSYLDTNGKEIVINATDDVSVPSFSLPSRDSSNSLISDSSHLHALSITNTYPLSTLTRTSHKETFKL